MFRIDDDKSSVCAASRTRAPGALLRCIARRDSACAWINLTALFRLVGKPREIRIFLFPPVRVCPWLKSGKWAAGGGGCYLERCMGTFLWEVSPCLRGNPREMPKRFMEPHEDACWFNHSGLLLSQFFASEGTASFLILGWLFLYDFGFHSSYSLGLKISKIRSESCGNVVIFRFKSIYKKIDLEEKRYMRRALSFGALNHIWNKSDP